MHQIYFFILVNIVHIYGRSHYLLSFSNYYKSTYIFIEKVNSLNHKMIWYALGWNSSKTFIVVILGGDYVQMQKTYLVTKQCTNWVYQYLIMYSQFGHLVAWESGWQHKESYSSFYVSPLLGLLDTMITNINDGLEIQK